MNCSLIEAPSSALFDSSSAYAASSQEAELLVHRLGLVLHFAIFTCVFFFCRSETIPLPIGISDGAKELV